MLRWAAGPALATATLCACTVLPFARPAGADSLGDARAKAAQLEQQIQATGAQISALGQQFDAAEAQIAQLKVEIAPIHAQAVATARRVAGDKALLARAAISQYVNSGEAASENPLFAPDNGTLGAAQEYSGLATNSVANVVANLDRAENQLSVQVSNLEKSESQASADAADALKAETQAQQVQAEQNAALAQVSGQIARLISSDEGLSDAQSAAELLAAQRAVGNDSSTFSPPAQMAIEAAESQLGVPYVWGGETPGVGFDCSGLVQWSYGQAGVSLPRTSGEQFEASTPIPLGDMQPGDLLFYGTDGDEHVAMYVGNDTMIEAPETGQDVHLTPVRLDDDFAGVGRPYATAIPQPAGRPG